MRKGFCICLMVLLALTAVGKPGRSIRLILLPDTQNYTESWPDIFNAQTQWIAAHARQIDFVLQQGDLTNGNAPEQWTTVSEAFGILDRAGVPYSFVPGNHDTGNKGWCDVRQTDLMNEYLPQTRYADRETFGGVFEQGHMENSYHTFRDGKYDFLVLSLEFGPRDNVLEWAGRIVKAHPRHNVIVNTHAYMYSDNNRMGAVEGHNWLPGHYAIGKEKGDAYANNGEEMWQKFVSRHPNIFLVVSGHVIDSGTGRCVSVGMHGNRVFQMLANYQTGVIGSERGGNGFLRIVDIDLAKKTMQIHTYSPYVDRFRDELDQSFDFKEVQLIRR